MRRTILVCGRFTLKTPAASWVQQLFPELQVLDLPAIQPRYNIAPTQSIVTVVQTETGGPLRAVEMRWGLLPPWATELSVGNNMINARSETLAEKPSFRHAFQKRRCLIIADGYYEWQKRAESKQPYWIHSAEGRTLAFAGLWESNRKLSPESPLLSTTIITTNANKTTSAVHDRMPVMFDQPTCLRWLDPDLEDASKLSSMLCPAPETWLALREVSTLVNNPRNERAACIDALL